MSNKISTKFCYAWFCFIWDIVFFSDSCELFIRICHVTYLTVSPRGVGRGRGAVMFVLVPACGITLKDIGKIIQGPISRTIFHRNSYSMEISFCSHPSCCEVIAKSLNFAYGTTVVLSWLGLCNIL